VLLRAGAMLPLPAQPRIVLHECNGVDCEFSNRCATAIDTLSGVTAGLRQHSEPIGRARSRADKRLSALQVPQKRRCSCKLARWKSRSMKTLEV
jgi:hypothetical protein